MTEAAERTNGIVPLRRLAAKVVVVTGAAKGIGAAIATRCVAEGAHVLLVDQDRDILEATVDVLNRAATDPSDPTASMVVGDIANEATVTTMIETAVNDHGRLDGLVNNAGIFGAYSRFEHNSNDDFERIVSVNVRAAWQAMKHAKPAMLSTTGAGSIVNIASMAAMRANRGLSLYGMTKGAIANLTINAATEYAKHNIRVNAICPGPIDTDMLGAVEEFIDERHSAVARARIEASIPLGRYGQPSEIAGAAAFLLSEDAGFVTGLLMSVDGGQSLE